MGKSPAYIDRLTVVNTHRHEKKKRWQTVGKEKISNPFDDKHNNNSNTRSDNMDSDDGDR